MNEFLPVAFYFQLSFSDITANHTVVFKELSGISMEMNTEEISDNSFKHRVHPSAKFSNLVLKRGMNAWPVKWAVSDLNSDNKIMIESLELAYGSFQ